MLEKKIEGFGVFYEDGHFTFDSGLPAAEPVIDFGVGVHHGVMNVGQNASTTFVPDPPRAIVPPAIDDVLKEENLSVKRTSRNFIVKMKFPIFEDADTTKQAHKEMWKKSLSAIASSREAIKETFN